MTLIIAEAGVNHNGSMDMAFKLIDAAAEAGADIVKFQTFKASNLVSRNAAKAEYQKQTTDKEESQLEMIKKLELTEEMHIQLIQHCQTRGIEFLSTPFDSDSLELLTGKFGMKTVKIPSGEITNAPFMLEIARVAQKIIISTGMCSLADIEAALGVLAFGMIADKKIQPSRPAFAMAFASDEGQQALQERVSILHCTTEYPAPFDEVNLRAMDTISQAFGLPVGYSDHTEWIHIPIAAVARGAKIIEKHFTLDKNLPGPDHKASLEPDELAAMIIAIRDVEKAIGNGIKKPTPSEIKNINIARKSLVAARDIKKGEPYDITCKRPGNGITPFDFWKFSGRVANRDYAPDEIIEE